MRSTCKCIYIFLYTFCFVGIIYSQNINIQQSNKSFGIKQNTDDILSFISNTGLVTKSGDVKTKAGNFSEIFIEGYGSSNIIGEPKLPVLKKIIEIPLCDEFNIEIIDYSIKEYNLKYLGITNPIMPAQPPASKGDDISKRKFEFKKEVYNKNEFIKYDLVKIVPLGIMRGMRIARLEISPVIYNPVKNIIRVYNDIEVKITFVNPDASKTNELRKSSYSPFFESTFKQFANNKDFPVSEVNFSRYPIKYVIVADPMFQSVLQPFVQWKTKKGFTVVEAYTNNPLVGTDTTSIKNYLKGLYEAGTVINPAPTFVLFVGDVAQIPAFSGKAGEHATDLYYCEYTGDDFPEVFYGRFSANDTNELKPQINKTLEYEQYLMSNPDFLGDAVLIAGVDATFAPSYCNGQINYANSAYVNPSNNLTPYVYLYPNSADSAAKIIQRTDSGACIINYTGHGGIDKWVNPAFTNSDVNNLTNAGRYPLMIGNCCLSNKFDEPLCFGEALMRADNKGAIGYIGASNNSYWDEDYYFSVGYRAIIDTNPVFSPSEMGFYDRLFHTHSEPFGEWFVTQGQIINAGNLAVTQSGSDAIKYYWEIYHLMGDPSLMPYLSVPSNLTVSYKANIIKGENYFTVTTEPYAYAALSMNNILYGAALADLSGTANIFINPVFPSTGTANVIVTKQNRKPYIGTVNVVDATGPFVVYNNKQIHDITGNNNNKADYGENINLDVTLKNVGISQANGVTAILSTSDNYFTITDSTHSWGNIATGDTSKQNNAFVFDIASNIPDQHVANFLVKSKDNDTSKWNSNFIICVNSPKLAIPGFYVDDVSTGNGNHRLEAGENAKIVMISGNQGHADSYNTSGVLSSLSSYVNITNSTVNLDTLKTSNQENAIFDITVNSATPAGTYIDFSYVLSSYLQSKTFNFLLPVGLADEDFETANFKKFNWDTSVTSVQWIINDTLPYEGLYCARSGAIGNNEYTELSIQLDVCSDDSISFYEKTSTETNYDLLTFYIDNSEIGNWSGDSAWKRVCYPVSAGRHNFIWTYSKDVLVAEGKDCAWLDFIIFPPFYINLQNVKEINENEKSFFTAYPNPFRNNITISYTLNSESSVKIELFDIMGNKIKTIVDKAKENSGKYDIIFNGYGLSNGIYYCVLKTDNEIKTSKIVLSK
ncbi:MAG: C25 family cysteine peptidase [Bacteroidales bacterium]|nr:C25 family cysteine peptidase [Bacteroidales bacterium]